MSRSFRVFALLALALVVPACNESDDEVIQQIINIVQPPPPPTIALLAADAHVGYDFNDDSAESSNLHAAINAMGLSATPFFDVSDATFASVLTGRTVLIIPEQEHGALDPVLAPETRTRIRDWVSAGGTMVMFLAWNGVPNDIDLINNVFSFSVTKPGNLSNPSFLDAMAAAGTPFEGGPSVLLYQDDTNVLATASLPPGAKALYVDSNGDSALTWIPFGQGRLIVHGYDWYDAQPIGTQNDGWWDVFRRSITTLPEVALFANTTYVDYTVGASGSEASNVQASLEAFGHPVTTFTGITGDEIATALQGRRILVLPEQSNGALDPDLDADGRHAIQSFVQGGGTLIAFWPNLSTLQVINSTFGFTLAAGGAITVPISRTAAADDTAFAGGPATLPNNNATSTVSAASLPPGALALYTEVGGEVVVARIPFGAGRIVIIGWDWFDAQPTGSQDGGWWELLRRATQD